jgi:raffinose/stachyose/melibiose transport system substrate-binding protein
MKSKAIALCLSLALLLIIPLAAACSSGAPATTAPAASAPAATPEAAVPEATPHPPVTINYMTFRTDDDAIMATLIEKFQQEFSYITVNRVSTKDATAYYQTLKANIVSNSDVDVFDIHPSVDFANYANDGTLADLSGLAFNADYLDSAKAITVINGKNYGYLNCVNMILCFYNKDMFAEAGVQVPTSYAELVSAVNTLKSKDMGGISYCGGDVLGIWLGNALVAESLGTDGVAKLWSDVDTGNITNLKDNAGYYTALQTLGKINKDGLLYDNASTIKYDQSLALFASKKAAIMMMGSWEFGTADKDIPGINFGIFPFPTLEKGNVAYAESGQITAVFAKSPNLDAAETFVNWLASPETAQAYLSATKQTGTIRGVTADYAGADMVTAVMDTGAAVSPIMNVKNSDAWLSAYYQVFTNTLFTSGDPDAEIAVLDTALQNAALKDK